MTQAPITPFEVLFTMDGNRRYAKRRGLPIFEGHRRGYEAFKNIAEGAFDLGITNAAFWALSKDNLEKRGKERDYLLRLLEEGIQEVREMPMFATKDIKFRAVGEWRSRLPWRVSGSIEKLEQDTKDRTGPVLTLLLAYDGQEDKVKTVERIRREVPRDQRITPGDITRRAAGGAFSHLDLYIRTGIGKNDMYFSNGELSLLMHCTGFHPTPVLWPNFTTKHLETIIEKHRRWKAARRKGA